MANFRFLKSRKRWQVRWQAKNRKSKKIFVGSKVFIEKSQAIKFYAEIESQEKLFREGKVDISESLESISQNFLRYIKRHTARTQQHYRMVLRLFLDSLPKTLVRIHQLDSSHIQEYLYRLRDKGDINRTLNAHLTVVKAFCRFYSDRCKIANPASQVSLLSEDPPDSRFLTKDEYRKIIDIAPQLAKDRIVFLANTGLRASEFSQLSNKSVSPQATAITIVGKGRRKRTVPLNKTAKAVLPYVKPATKNALYLQFTRLAKKAGIEKFGPHALRHYCATQLLLNRIPVATVSKIMGVSIRVIEKHYAHILTADIENATDVLD